MIRETLGEEMGAVRERCHSHEIQIPLLLLGLVLSSLIMVLGKAGFWYGGGILLIYLELDNTFVQPFFQLSFFFYRYYQVTYFLLGIIIISKVIFN